MSGGPDGGLTGDPSQKAEPPRLVVGVQAGLREGVEALGRHHAGHRLEGRLHVAQLGQEECGAQEPDLPSTGHQVLGLSSLEPLNPGPGLPRTGHQFYHSMAHLFNTSGI